jgi:hypothetical protein
MGYVEFGLAYNYLLSFKYFLFNLPSTPKIGEIIFYSSLILGEVRWGNNTAHW